MIMPEHIVKYMEPLRFDKEADPDELHSKISKEVSINVRKEKHLEVIFHSLLRAPDIIRYWE